MKRLLLVFALLATMAACGDDGISPQPSAPAPAPAITSVDADYGAKFATFIDPQDGATWRCLIAQGAHNEIMACNRYNNTSGEPVEPQGLIQAPARTASVVRWCDWLPEYEAYAVIYASAHGLTTLGGAMEDCPKGSKYLSRDPRPADGPTSTSQVDWPHGDDGATP